MKEARRRRVWLRYAGVLAGVALLLAPARVLAGNGWYMGADLGAALGTGLDVDGTDNDYPTRCDEVINPDGVGVEAGDCDAPTPASLLNEFDSGGGVLAGLQLGYRWRDFRIEGEYFYRGATHDDVDEVFVRGQDATSRMKLNEEVDIAEGALDNVFSHNFFANLYYDFHSNSNFTPYVGFGLGVSRVSLDYFTRWTRNLDPGDINTFEDDTVPMGDVDPTPRLAGTTTIGRGNFSDVLFGYQAIAGVDYRVSDPVTIGLKFRWADYFGDFSDDAEYDRLRGHAPVNSRDSTDPRSARVRYGVSTDDISFWGVSLNMKYAFDPSAPAGAATAGAVQGSGMYVGMDLGVAVGRGLTTQGVDNDLNPECDRYIVEDATCTDMPNFDFVSQFDGGKGALAGLAVGYRWNSVRVEGEYFYHDTNYDSTYSFDPSAVDDFDAQFSGEEEIDDVVAHNFFANLYYDVRSDSKWTPYFGGGVGFALVSLDYFNDFQRNIDPGNDAAQARLAGTNSIGRGKLTDTLFGYQVVGGLDYRFSNPVSIGLKFRYVSYNEFEDSSEYQQLRSHDSNNAPAGDDMASPAHRNRVRYNFRTDDLSFWGVSLNLKYHF